LWLDSTDGTLYVYYEDVDGAQWIQVQANSALGASIESRLGALESQAIAYGNQNPNVIINGGFDIWQRGTSFTADGYCADRWYFDETGTCTVSQETTSLPEGVRYALKAYAGSGNDSADISQSLETFTVIPLRGKTVTLSFYIKTDSDASANIANIEIAVDYSNATDARTSQTTSVYSSFIYPSDYVNTWTRVSATFVVPSDALGLKIGFEPARTPDVLGAVGTYWLANVQLEQGSTATSFRRNANNIQGELAACQRYYYRINGSGNTFTTFGQGYANSATSFRLAVTVPSPIRINPSVEWSGSNSFTVRGSASAGVTFQSVVIDPLFSSESLPVVQFTTSGTMTLNGHGLILSNNSTTSWLALNGEL
jgi:hypothetical protein